MDSNRIEEVRKKVSACEAEIAKGIIGQQKIIRQVLIAMMSGGNVLLEGVPGLGKTQLVKTIAKVVGLQFSRIQFTPDLMPADVTGTNLILQEDGRNTFRFEQGPVFANLVLADEINRATPKTQAALLEAMQEKTVTVGKQTYTLPLPFLVLATQNPIEHEGTYPLPEAQLDRFLFKILIDFPSTLELKKIMNITVNGDAPELSQKLTGVDILEAGEIIRNIPMADNVQQYALRLVVATHPESPEGSGTARQYLACGASPRAAQALYLAAKARAFFENRMNVSFEDVDAAAYPSLRHRLLLNYDAVSEGLTADDLIGRITEELRR